jgi:hypothetical protein
MPARLPSLQRAALAALTLLSSACTQHARKPDEQAPRAQGIPQAQSQPLSRNEAGPQVAAAVQRGDYAQAVSLTERTALPKPELDQAVGLLVLDSLVDVRAATHPPGNLEDGLRRVEDAALAGFADAAANLRALFHNGLTNQSMSVQLAASPQLESCWADVADGAGPAARCVELRRGVGE